MTNSLSAIIRVFCVLLLPAAVFAPAGVAAAADLVVYGDALGAGWQNWSWDTTADFSATSPVHGGRYALAATYTAAWAGLYLATNGTVDGSSYDTLQFWIHGGSQGGQKLRVILADESQTLLGQTVDVQASAGKWTQVKILLSALGSPAGIGGIVFQDTTGAAQPAFALDDISFVKQGIPPLPTTDGPALHIDARANRHAISEEIYGMNYADEALAAALRLPVRRWGGNSATRYNWKSNIHNVGSDWYFENIPDGEPVTDGSASDLFIDQDRRTGTRTIMTVPLIGWTAASRSPRNHPYDCGFKVSKYGAQQSTDQWDSDCGNGVHANGTNITGNAAADTSTQIGPSFVTDWVRYLVGKYGTASNGGVAYYDLDNEPMLWNSTHRDVHPKATSYDEMKTRTWQYGAAVKAADPTAGTLGPVLWGWCAYFYSAVDGCSAGQDYAGHGNKFFVPWYLQQMKAYEQKHAVRILDFLDLHYYPQATGVALSQAGDSSTQALRLRSTRSLWDPSYIDESWISDTASGGVAVRLIPRMKAWVAANYPGTGLAVTEYNWGALNHINGALAQADVLGIFGREGLDLATLWGPPAPSDPGAFAFRMYRNYDGAKHGFGDVSTKAVSGNQGKLAVYAAERSADKALTVMVINKVANPLKSTVTLAGYTPAPKAAVYRYSSAKYTAIQHPANQAVTAAGFNATLPGNSITLFVMKPGTVPRVPGAPTGVKAAVGNAQATVKFTPSSSNGTSPITSYTVASSPGGVTGKGPASPITVKGLTSGKTYTFTVKAKNAVGFGPASKPSNSVTPR